MKHKKFWVWKNQNEDGNTQRVLELNGTIAEESWFDDDVTPEMFKKELFAETGPVVLWINSPGGDCIAASRIYSMLMEYPEHVTVKIDGIAASAASVIAMAGTTVLMAPTALLMIHNPMTVAWGDHQDMQKAAGMLGEVKESIINAYELRTGLRREQLSTLMDSETWMNAHKAIELGFADALLADEKRATATDHSFAYSSKTAQVALLNKIVEKQDRRARGSGKKEKSASFDELEKRLNLIKPQ